MGLKDIASLGQRVFEHKLDAAAQAHAGQPDRVDTGLPFGARIGSLLELPRADFAVLDRSLLKTPEHAQMPIVAVSRSRVAAAQNLDVFRLYTSLGADRKGVGRSFLQIQRSGEEIAEVAYYQHFLRQIPATREDMAPYLGQGFGLGQIGYSLARDLLQASGLTPEQVTVLIGTEGDELALEYTRDTPTDVFYVKPYRSTETRLDDAIGEKGQSADETSMDYKRTLSGGEVERLLITLEYVSEMDGATDEAAHVDFLVGLAFEPPRIKII